MISRELEITLHDAFIDARQERHEFITVEHLLLGLLDNQTAADFLLARGTNISDLRTSLVRHLAEHSSIVAGSDEFDTQPNAGFQRVIQRAILQAQSTDRQEVTGADVLIAIFKEKDSPVAHYLRPKDTFEPADSGAPEAIVQRQLDAYNARDMDAFLATYADDAELFEFPATSQTRGKEEMRKRYAPRFSDTILHAVIVKRIVMGNVVIDHERVRVTLPAGPGVMEAIAIYEVSDGEIAKATFIVGEKTPGEKL
jgi:hypothetical protein